MIIKKLIRFSSCVLSFIGISTIESCKDDESSDLCYFCDGDIDGSGKLNETYCLSDFKKYGYTKDEFEEFIDYLNDYGGSCSKK